MLHRFACAMGGFFKFPLKKIHDALAKRERAVQPRAVGDKIISSPSKMPQGMKKDATLEEMIQWMNDRYSNVVH